MRQSGLRDFGDERPAAEARAVAGDGQGQAQAVVDPGERRYPDPDGELELAVTQVDYTLDGSGRDERPVLHVFGRTVDGVAEHVRVHGFRPYFYAPTETLTDELLSQAAILDTEPGYTSIRGEALTRLYARTPRDVGEVRDRFDHYEADILFPNRLLIDKGITSGVRVPVRRAADGALDVPHDELEAVEVTATRRVNTFDLEVDDRSGFPEDGEEPILCLTSHDSTRDEYVVWHFVAPDGDGETPDALADHELLDASATVEVRNFTSEAAMLEAFLDYLDETDPDVLTGWNFADFDAPYLLDRLGRLDGRSDHDLDPNRLSRVNEVWRSDWQGPNVKGRVVFDLLYAYKRTQFSELDSYRLDAVGEVELGVGKERYAGDIGDLWEREPTRLLEYNLRDVELCVEIDRKQGIVAFWEEVASFVGCKLEDATTPGDAVDMYVLHKASGKFALPSKGSQPGEEFEGGAVFDPITGVREMVAVLDLASLYPMAMVTMNASPETKVDEDYAGETYVAPNGQRYRVEPDGIMREMVAELLAERTQKKARRDEHDPGTEAYARFDRQQAAVKVIMNSLYGVSGWERFRLYDRENAAAVTSTGREVIKFTEKTVNKLNKEVIYGDTDSVMLELGGEVSMDEAIEQAFEIESHINGRYDAFALEVLNAREHRFHIEFEKLYRRFFQAGKKKRYAGHLIWKEGKDVDEIDITGFEYKRSDIAPVTKRVQQGVIEMIVRGESIETVTDYVHEVIEEFERGDLDLDDIGIPSGIGKRLDEYDTDTAHVRGAKYANLLLGTNFQRGSKPKRLYLAKVHPSFYQHVEAERGLDPQRDPLYLEFKQTVDSGDGVICFEYADQVPDAFQVDWDKMLEKTLRGPIARVLEALDVSWEEVRTGQEQTGLESFM